MAKKVLCPNCGIWHSVEGDPNRGTFENIAKRLFTDTRRKPHKSEAAAIPLPLPRQPVSLRETPSLPTRESHIKIPLEEAVISGLLAAFKGGTVGLGLCLLVNSIPDIPLTFTNWGVAGITAAAAGITGFYVMDQTWNNRRGFYDGLLWTVEEVFGMDLNRDGDIGEPEPSPVEAKTVTVELTQNGIPREREDFGIDPARLSELARLVIVVKEGFSEATAAKAGIGRKEWVPFRDKFLERGWATWNNSQSKKQGISPTLKGAAILQGFLPPTLPGVMEGRVEIPPRNART